MPLRVVLDEGSVRPEDVALVGARALDPPEVEFLEASGIDSDLGRALSSAEAVYVALDLDVLTPGQVSSFMPEPGGPSVAEVEAILRDVASRIEVAGLGLTAFLPDADPATLGRFPIALGL
jgi:arginase